MEPFATSTTVTGPVGERLQAGTEDAPVLDCPAPLRRLRDSGAGYEYPDLLTYLVSVEPLYVFVALSCAAARLRIGVAVRLSVCLYVRLSRR